MINRFYNQFQIERKSPIVLVRRGKSPSSSKECAASKLLERLQVFIIYVVKHDFNRLKYDPELYSFRFKCLNDLKTFIDK